MTNEHATGPLAGVRVLELGTVLMIPYAAQILGDLGAEVIKVESKQLDPGRLLGGGDHRELASDALNFHRNKRSIVLDLATAGGREVFDRLIDSADVLVTNLLPGALRRKSLDYESLKAINADLIYCDAHGFRADSPEADRPAFDDIIQAETGLTRLAEATGGVAGFLPSVLADKLVGAYVVQAVLAALFARERGLGGQRIEVPMFDVVLAFNLVDHLAHATFPGGEAGYSRVLTSHRGPHRTADGLIAIMPYSDDDWRNLYKSTGREAEFDGDPIFADAASRHAHSDHVYSSLATIMPERTTAEWLELCAELGIAASPAPTFQEIVEDETRHRGVLQEAHHPARGTYRQIRPPFVFGRTPMGVRSAAPLVGEHTAEVMAELGYSPDEIRALVAGDAVRTRPRA